MAGSTARSALITGASRGIGRGIALSLASRGYALTISSRDDLDLKTLSTELVAAGSPHVEHLAVDMADRAGVQELVASHARTFGSLHALVINAGVGTAGNVAGFRLDRLDKTVAVNFSAPFVLMQSALPSLRRGAQEDPERGAKIIALSSITGVYAESGLAAYGASKAALLSLIDTINHEEARSGVTAAAIAPGYVDTDMSAWIKETIPAHEMIRVADVVAVVDMLLNLGRNTSITRIVMSRSTGSGYEA
jgi:NAD(P)-dependent dehydrogenase (short-subunit alcohol dehydrogenase family)